MLIYVYMLMAAYWVNFGISHCIQGPSTKISGSKVPTATSYNGILGPATSMYIYIYILNEANTHI